MGKKKRVDNSNNQMKKITICFKKNVKKRKLDINIAMESQGSNQTTIALMVTLKAHYHVG